MWNFSRLVFLAPSLSHFILSPNSGLFPSWPIFMSSSSISSSTYQSGHLHAVSHSICCVSCFAVVGFFVSANGEWESEWAFPSVCVCVCVCGVSGGELLKCNYGPVVGYYHHYYIILTGPGHRRWRRRRSNNSAASRTSNSSSGRKTNKSSSSPVRIKMMQGRKLKILGFFVLVEREKCSQFQLFYGQGGEGDNCYY